MTVSKNEKPEADAGSVKSSFGRLITWKDVIEPFLVVVIRYYKIPKSVARVGWYPTAEGIRPSNADNSEHAWVNLKILSIINKTSFPY